MNTPPTAKLYSSIAEHDINATPTQKAVHVTFCYKTFK